MPFDSAQGDKLWKIFAAIRVYLWRVVIARHEAILKRTQVAIVVRLLRLLKKPSRNDDL